MGWENNDLTNFFNFAICVQILLLVDKIKFNQIFIVLLYEISEKRRKSEKLRKL